MSPVDDIMQIMGAQGNIVETYVTDKGDVPFTDWLDHLKDRKARVAVEARVGRLRLGNVGYCRDLKDGVWELKIDFGPGYRVYFGRAGKHFYLLLAGGDKNSQNAD